MAQQRQLSGSVSNAKQLVTWRASCAESPPTGPGNVDLLCEGDIARKDGSSVRVFYWQKHAGTNISTGSIPCFR